MFARNAALDEEWTVDMVEFTTIRERMTKLRNKNKVFHHDMIDKLQKMRGTNSIL